MSANAPNHDEQGPPTREQLADLYMRFRRSLAAAEADQAAWLAACTREERAARDERRAPVVREVVLAVHRTTEEQELKARGLRGR